MATKVHRVRYYNPKPQSINCISLNNTNKKLALARSDASIEIWDLNYAPYLLNFIPGVENGSVEALGWVHDRLLSTGLGGALVEWDLEKLRVRNSVLLTGYAAWCLDVSSDNTMVAVGTEQGYVNLYNVENNEIIYKKLFDKQEGRILCCKFNKTGNNLVTGSINTIRVWNVETGQATTRMLVSRRGKEVIVWCITILSDNTIVSGDSHGRLTFWDSIIGNELESYITHKADILSIAVSEDEESLFCSGVDPVISNFVRIKNKQDSDAQWVKHVQRNIHEHDVRGLVLNGKELISVGIDGYLTFSSYPPKWVMRIPHMLPAPRSAVCAEKKLLLLRYSHHIEVWKLGSCTVNDTDNALINDNTHTKDRNHQVNNLEEDSIMDKITIANNVPKQNLRITEKPMKLVSVQTKGKKQIKSCELSPSGEFIVYSTDSHVRMLKLETDEDQNNISLSKVMVNGLSSGCERFAFTNDSRWMIVYCTGNVNILQVDPEAGATVVQSLPVEKHLSTKSIVHLLVSKETRSGVTYLIVADTLGSITVWMRRGKKFEHYIDLPKYQCVPSAMAVDNEYENLIITYVDQKIVEYDLVNKKFTEWPGSGISPEWYQRSAAVDSILPHPNGNAVLFQDITALWVMDRRTGQESNEPDLKKKFQRPGDMNFGLKVIPIKYIADFHWIGEDEAVLLEVLPENIVSQLPAVAVTNKKRDRI